MSRIPTALLAGGSLILAYAVVVISDSRPLGGIVLAIGGLWCIRAWARSSGSHTAALLTCVGLGAFVLSHLLALAIGPWPAVLAAAALLATVSWIRADAPGARTAAPGSH